MLGGDSVVQACVECGAYSVKATDSGFGIVSDECKKRRLNPGRNGGCLYPIGTIPVVLETTCVE